ncbi:class F sortase [Streptomyces piniterrae]|uniref:Class F sortase n=1 Tax=Streptomyces piniterrae TaxID=2571125 RepID=A0A4V5ML64_9ACTN|nr:sortase [Streptomyces piniterrae]TJZ55978.1 class F sortase [Streptomyces piniterrae]
MRAEGDEGEAGRTGGPGRRHGQLLIGVAWAALLLGLWLWGRGMTGGTDLGAARVPTTGDVAAVGRPPEQAPQSPEEASPEQAPTVRTLPSARAGKASPYAHHAPLGLVSPRAHHALAASGAVKPGRITIGVLGVDAAIVERGHHGSGGASLSPPRSPDLVGWYADGPQPGAEGVAVLVGRVGGDARRAVFHGLGGVRPGDRVDVRRTDGSTAQFTVEDVRRYDREHLDVQRVHDARQPGRSELRLVGRGGGADPARRAGTTKVKVVVSAYLTGFQGAHADNAADG